jgi:hypothetical protein
MIGSRALLRLYPRAWRERYGEEMSLMLAAQPASLRLAVDLVAGAIDARVNPQFAAPLRSVPPQRGERTMTGLFAYCRPSDITIAEHLRAAGWLLGATLVMTAGTIGLKAWLGETPMVEALEAAVFPVAVALSMRANYLKRYSRAAAWTIIGGTIVLVLAITLGAALLARAI